MPRAQQSEIADPVRETTQRRRLSPEKFSAQLGVSLQNVKIAGKWLLRTGFKRENFGAGGDFFSGKCTAPLREPLRFLKTAAVGQLYVFARNFRQKLRDALALSKGTQKCGTSTGGAEAKQLSQRFPPEGRDL